MDTTTKFFLLGVAFLMVAAAAWTIGRSGAGTTETVVRFGSTSDRIDILAAQQKTIRRDLDELTIRIVKMQQDAMLEKLDLPTREDHP